ncbi:MAG: hypothetical protein ACXW36_11720, partial [Nitrospira sp.]
MVVQRGRSERRGEAYCASYVELLSDARTKLEAIFNILPLLMFEPASDAHILTGFRGDVGQCGDLDR